MTQVGIIYYSRSGTGRMAAERLAEMSNWPLYEIRDDNARIGLSGDIRCVIDTLIGRHPPIHYEGPGLDSFDDVILISPVWLRSLAAPMRAFLRHHRREIKNYTAILVLSGYGGLQTLDEMATIIGMKPRFTLLLKQYDVLGEACGDALYNLKEHFEPRHPPEGSSVCGLR